MFWNRKKETLNTEPYKSSAEKLVEARAKLARLELLPDEDFTVYPSLTSGYVIRHGVDEKPKVIARQKAKIAELEALVEAKEEEKQ